MIFLIWIGTCTNKENQIMPIWYVYWQQYSDAGGRKSNFYYFPTAKDLKNLSVLIFFHFFKCHLQFSPCLLLYQIAKFYCFYMHFYIFFLTCTLISTSTYCMHFFMHLMCTFSPLASLFVHVFNCIHVQPPTLLNACTLLLWNVIWASEQNYPILNVRHVSL